MDAVEDEAPVEEGEVIDGGGGKSEHTIERCTAELGTSERKKSGGLEPTVLRGEGAVTRWSAALRIAITSRRRHHLFTLQPDLRKRNSDGHARGPLKRQRAYRTILFFGLEELRVIDTYTSSRKISWERKKAWQILSKIKGICHLYHCTSASPNASYNRAITLRAV